MVNKPLCVCLYWHSCVRPHSGLFYWTVGLAELQSLIYPVKLAVYSIVYNCVKYKYEAIHTQSVQKKIFRHLTLERVQMNACNVILSEL